MIDTDPDNSDTGSFHMTPEQFRRDGDRLPGLADAPGAPVPLNLVCFRLKGEDDANPRPLHDLNASGALFPTHTRVADRYTLRSRVGQRWTTEQHVQAAWDHVRRQADHAHHGSPSPSSSSG